MSKVTETLDKNLFYLNEQKKQFTAEISAIGLSELPRILQLKDSVTGKLYKFYYSDCDMKGVEIYGWWYNCNNKYKLLVIND